MSKFSLNPVVGIDVSADFSYVAILAPNGDTFKKPFKIIHDSNGFNYLVETIKKVEEEFSMKSAIFMESTGVYHLPLFHFLNERFDNTFTINPLVTKYNNNSNIRKAKNDKLDSLKIANIAKFQNVKYSKAPDMSYFVLKKMLREYYKLTDRCSDTKKKLSTDLRIIFPGYCDIFSDLTSMTSLAILTNYSTPNALLSAPKDDILKILSKARKGNNWSLKIYSDLIKKAQDASVIAVKFNFLNTFIASSIDLINTYDRQISNLLSQIDSFIYSDLFPENIRTNISLVDSIHGIGHLTAATLIAEIGDINDFIKPKKLIAFLGIDSSVKDSGKFKSTNNKISKRGTRYGRRALYAVALASIRNSRNGSPINSVLQQYYNNNLNGKQSKVALIAITHKIVLYIYSVLKNQKPFNLRDPMIHKQMYLENHNTDTNTVA